MTDKTTDIWPMRTPDEKAAESWPFLECEALAREAECFETPEWAVEAILAAELLTGVVVDPCCGTGVMTRLAAREGYNAHGFDKFDWGYGVTGVDFLEDNRFDGLIPNQTVFMNPPFKHAVAFVNKALAFDARKIVAFQRLAWFESDIRTEFWEALPPQRIYLMAQRASCWRVDIPPEKRRGGTPTAHAWFVWERGQPRGPIIKRLHKPKRRG